jgi:hypothetical protein
MHDLNWLLQNSKAASESVLFEFGNEADGNALQDLI